MHPHLATCKSAVVSGVTQLLSSLSSESSLKLHPLHELLCAGQPWKWLNICVEAFQQAKQNLVQAPVLAHYDPQLPLIFSGDASAYGVGAVISHKLPDGSERLVAFCITDTVEK